MKTNIISMESIVKHIHISHAMEINNTSTSQSLKLLIIPYTTNQPADPQLWDSNFCLISLFEIYEYLKDDTQNVTFSLLKMMAFIKQYPLENKMAKDISQILEFRFVA